MKRLVVTGDPETGLQVRRCRCDTLQSDAWRRRGEFTVPRACTSFVRGIFSSTTLFPMMYKAGDPATTARMQVIISKTSAWPIRISAIGKRAARSISTFRWYRPIASSGRNSDLVVYGVQLDTITGQLAQILYGDLICSGPYPITCVWGGCSWLPGTGVIF